MAGLASRLGAQRRKSRRVARAHVGFSARVAHRVERPFRPCARHRDRQSDGIFFGADKGVFLRRGGRGFSFIVFGRSHHGLPRAAAVAIWRGLSNGINCTASRGRAGSPTRADRARNRSDTRQCARRLLGALELRTCVRSSARDKPSSTPSAIECAWLGPTTSAQSTRTPSVSSRTGISFAFAQTGRTRREERRVDFSAADHKLAAWRPGSCPRPCRQLLCKGLRAAMRARQTRPGAPPRRRAHPIAMQHAFGKIDRTSTAARTSSCTVLTAVAEALGLAPDAFERQFSAGDMGTIRLLRYPGAAEAMAAAADDGADTAVRGRRRSVGIAPQERERESSRSCTRTRPACRSSPSARRLGGGAVAATRMGSTRPCGSAEFVVPSAPARSALHERRAARDAGRVRARARARSSIIRFNAVHPETVTRAARAVSAIRPSVHAR